LCSSFRVFQCLYFSTGVETEEEVEEIATVSAISSGDDALHIKTTQRLLDAPLGSYDSHTWYEADNVFRFWNRQRSTESVQYALHLLQRCIQEYCHQCRKLDRVVPLPMVLTTANLNFTINNWQACAKSLPTPASRTGLLNPTEMLEIIDELVSHYKTEPAILRHRDEAEHLPLQPNIYTYSMIIDALAFSQPDRVQSTYEVEQSLGEALNDNSKDANGNIGWTYLETPAPIIAERLLERLFDDCQSNPYLRPNIVTLNSVIHVLCRSRLPEAPERAEALLRQAQKLSLSSSDWKELKPNRTTYGVILNCWGNSFDENAPIRAEALLEEMKASSDPDLFPSSEACLGALKAWGHSQNFQAAQHANELLQELIRKYREGLEQSKRDDSPQRFNKETWQDIKPGIACFLAVMNIYSQNGDTEGAGNLLDQLETLYEESNRDADLCPNAAAFNCVLLAWSRSSSMGAQVNIKALMQRMQTLAESTGNSELYPDVVTYNSLLHALSRSDDTSVALLEAQEVFKTMQNTPGIQPDVITYNVILHLLARCRERNAAEQAENFLRHFWSRHHSGDIDFKPDNQSYNTCIDAWSKSPRHRKDQIDRAEALFNEMQDLCMRTGDERLKPSKVSYGSMISVCGRSGTKAGAEKAQWYFDEMVANGITPSIIEYNAAIHAWAGVGGVEEAEALVNRALEDFQNGNNLAKPDVKSFSSLLNAISKRRKSRNEALHDALKAESILVRMEDLSKILGPGVMPNTYTFNAVLDCFAKCRNDPSAVKHAEAILDHMKALTESGIHNVHPNVVSITTVMNCWVYSNLPETPDRVEALFQYLKDQYERTKRSEFKPSQYTYNALIGAYARNSIKIDALDKAMGHFNDMMKQFKLSGDDDIRPGPMHFSVILSALAKRGMAKEAESFFGEVLAICRAHHESDNEKLEISSSFNNVISSHARSRLPGAAIKAEAWLRRMQDLGPHEAYIDAKPNVISYTSAMTAWSRVTDHEEKNVAVEKCEELLQEMLEEAKTGNRDVMPNQFTFGTFLRVVARSNVLDKSDRATQVLQFMEHCGMEPDEFVQSAARECIR